MGMRVRLKKGLTKYHPSLTEGSLGEVIGAFGKFSREHPKAFVGVRFDEHTLDVLLRDLERVFEKPKPKDGPQVPVQSDKPPKRGQVVEFEGIRFKVEGIQERLGTDLWLVNVSPE